MNVLCAKNQLNSPISLFLAKVESIKSMDETDVVHIAGISGLISSTFPLIMIIISTIIESSFSWNRNALSDIGVSQTGWLFNNALIVGGVLNFLFAIGLLTYFEKTKTFTIGVSLIIISSVSLALVGVFTENFGNIHVLVALGYLLLAPLGLICIGVGKKRDQTGIVSLVLGIIALLIIFGLSVIAFFANLQIGFAVPELAESLVLSIWIFWLSLKLVRYASS